MEWSEAERNEMETEILPQKMKERCPKKVLLWNGFFHSHMYPSDQLLTMKEKMIKKVLAKEMKVKELADHFDVSRQSASKWISKYRFGGMAELTPKKSGPKSGSTWNRTETDTEEKVIELAREHPFKGPLSLSQELSEEGIVLHQTTVYRILKRRQVRYCRDYKHAKRKRKSYCLDIPGREIQLDCSFPFGYKKKAVISDAIDDCSRFVFGKVLRDHTAQSTIVFLQEVIHRSTFPIRAIRTDQGREFLNKDVKEFLEKNNIEHRINPPYTPQHNGKIERFHKTLKNDAVYCDWYFNDDLETLNYKFTQFLFFYNYKRKHTGLGMNTLTPVEKIALTTLESSYDENVHLILQQNRYVQRNQKMVY